MPGPRDQNDGDPVSAPPTYDLLARRRKGGPLRTRVTPKDDASKGRYKYHGWKRLLPGRENDKTRTASEAAVIGEGAMTRSRTVHGLARHAEPVTVQKDYLRGRRRCMTLHNSEGTRLIAAELIGLTRDGHPTTPTSQLPTRRHVTGATNDGGTSDFCLLIVPLGRR